MSLGNQPQIAANPCENEGEFLMLFHHQRGQTGCLPGPAGTSLLLCVTVPDADPSDHLPFPNWENAWRICGQKCFVYPFWEVVLDPCLPTLSFQVCVCVFGGYLLVLILSVCLVSREDKNPERGSGSLRDLLKQSAGLHPQSSWVRSRVGPEHLHF